MKREKEQTPKEGLVSARELLRNVPALKQISPVKMRMIESSEIIRDAQPEEIAYQHSVLCQTSLPYRSTTQRRWEAQNGNVMLLIQAGEAFDPHSDRRLA